MDGSHAGSTPDHGVAAYVTRQYNVASVTLYDWEGNRRSGIALVMRCRLDYALYKFTTDTYIDVIVANDICTFTFHMYSRL